MLLHNGNPKEIPWGFEISPKKSCPQLWIDRFFLKSWKFFRPSKSKQNLLADRMEALSASEKHSQPLKIQISKSASFFSRNKVKIIIVLIWSLGEWLSEAESASIRSASKFCFDLDVRIFFNFSKNIFFGRSKDGDLIFFRICRQFLQFL